jgi:hypothetical protein
MGYLLKQSSTGRPLLFLMVDSADHLTGKTGLSPTVTLSKNGATFAAPSGSVTELSNGWYKVAGNATDTGTLGPLLLHATASGADPCDDRFDVVAFDPDSGLATAAGQTSILNAVNAITTNTARSMPVVPAFLVRPAAGSTVYQVMLYLYNLQGILEDADGQAVTIHARTATGTGRDANLAATAMTRVSAGKYTVTYTVASTHEQEAVYFDFIWAVGGTSMADSGATEVQDAESLATLLAVKSKTDKLTFDGANHVLSSPQTTVTLAGSSGANAPSAATSQADVYTTAFKNGTARLCARVFLDGADIHQAAVSSLVYSVFLLDNQDPDARTVVTGHSAVSLAPADVIFDTLQSDLQASDFNFRHVVPIGVHPAFAIAGRNYLVEYTITPVLGQKTILRFRVNVL